MGKLMRIWFELERLVSWMKDRCCLCRDKVLIVDNSETAIYLECIDCHRRSKGIHI